jgi:hypothetical protein
MPIFGSGNNEQLALEGNVVATSFSKVDGVNSNTSPPSGFTMISEVNSRNDYLAERKLPIAYKVDNVTSLDPGNFGNYGTTDIGTTIAIRPSGSDAPVFNEITKSKGAATSMTVNIPLLRPIGDLLMIYGQKGTSGGTLGTPAGWTALIQATSSNGHVSVFYKVIDGSEANTVTITESAAWPVAFMSFRVSGYQGTPEGASANSGPPSLTPSWGAANNLWLTSQYGWIGSPSYGYPELPQGSIYGAYHTYNYNSGDIDYLNDPPRMSVFRDRPYYTIASYPSALYFPNTNLSIGHFYGVGPDSGEYVLVGDGGGK